jgi:hypothetical protein
MRSQPSQIRRELSATRHELPAVRQDECEARGSKPRWNESCVSLELQEISFETTVDGSLSSPALFRATRVKYQVPEERFSST